MAGRDDILATLARVVDPFLHKPITELGLVKEAEVVGDSARVKIALPVGDRDWAERLDADVWGFSMPLMLGVDRPPIALEGLIVPPVSYGVALISIGFFVEEGEPIIWRGPMLHKVLEQFITDVYWGDPDYLIIDMPPGT